MGPGSFDPGSHGLTEHRFRHLRMLQWGRGLSTPEVSTMRADCVITSALQWGRGLSTPEVYKVQTYSNLAALLQWGPGSFDPGSFRA